MRCSTLATWCAASNYSVAKARFRVRQRQGPTAPGSCPSDAQRRRIPQGGRADHAARADILHQLPRYSGRPLPASASLPAHTWQPSRRTVHSSSFCRQSFAIQLCGGSWWRTSSKSQVALSRFLCIRAWESTSTAVRFVDTRSELRCRYINPCAACPPDMTNLFISGTLNSVNATTPLAAMLERFRSVRHLVWFGISFLPLGIYLLQQKNLIVGSEGSG